jgi:hypothetical protein
MKQILRSFRSLFARLGLLSAAEPQQLDFLSTLEITESDKATDRRHSLSK